MTRIPIVNEQDEIVCYKEREETTCDDIRRITSLHLFNSKGEYLVARRHFSKKIHPGKWGPSVAGTMEKGESYESNIAKEVQEELGLTGLNISFLEKKYYTTHDGTRRYRSSFIAHTDAPLSDLKLQESEVIDARWISLKELYEWFEKTPDDFVPSFSGIINFLKDYETQHQS